MVRAIGQPDSFQRFLGAPLAFLELPTIYAGVALEERGGAPRKR